MTIKKTSTIKKTAKKVTAKSSAVKKEVLAKNTTDIRDKASMALNSINENIDNVQGTAKKVWFAGLGAVGKTVEELQSRYTKGNDEVATRYSKLKQEREELMSDLLARGEKVQDQTQNLIKERRVEIEEKIELAKGRMTGLVSVINLPARLQEVSDKLEQLSKNLKKAS